MFTIYNLYEKHKREIEEFKNNCNHRFEDGTSAIIINIDDEDIEDSKGNVFHEATYEKWEQCKICGTQKEVC